MATGSARRTPEPAATRARVTEPEPMPDLGLGLRSGPIPGRHRRPNGQGCVPTSLSLSPEASAALTSLAKAMRMSKAAAASQAILAAWNEYEATGQLRATTPATAGGPPPSQGRGRGPGPAASGPADSSVALRSTIGTLLAALPDEAVGAAVAAAIGALHGSATPAESEPAPDEDEEP